MQLEHVRLSQRLLKQACWFQCGSFVDVSPHRHLVAAFLRPVHQVF